MSEEITVNGSSDSTLGAGSRGAKMEDCVAILSFFGTRLSKAPVAADEV